MLDVLTFLNKLDSLCRFEFDGSFHNSDDIIDDLEIILDTEVISLVIYADSQSTIKIDANIISLKDVISICETYKIDYKVKSGYVIFEYQGETYSFI